MEISDYEQYYQKGGTYVLPIEVFNELWGEMENWKDTCKQKENIIKEVRAYIMTELITEWDIKNDGCVSGSDLPVDAITPILEILDKEEINNGKD